MSPTGTVSTSVTSVPRIDSTPTAFVAAQRHEGLVAPGVDVEAGGLLADREGAGEPGRARLEVDDVELVIRGELQGVAVLDDAHRVRDQRHGAGRIDREVDRRADDRVLERKVGDDL